MNKTIIKCAMSIVAGLAVASSTNARASVTQTIEPTTIGLGEAARLTIAASGNEADSITAPTVAGLEFVVVTQSQRIESINGTTHATRSVTFQVIPQQAGVFTIPSETSGAEPVVLTVDDGHGSLGAAHRSAANALPQASAATRSSGAMQTDATGSAFVRLRLSKHDLYVGETIPVDIQVGTRDGVVASLNGQPTLNGDAFTLNKLAEKPQRTAEVIDGKPYTVFTWHSALAAVKPGRLSLTMETPLTVRLRSAARPDIGGFGGMDIDDLFNDSTLQSFFGTSTEKEVTVTSAPAAFDVQALPVQGRPVEFTGAVGHFTVSSDVSEDKAAAGDPVTLRLHVAGSGNFDRVNSPMLHAVEHWKTYAPTATFKGNDPIGYAGEKTFDQPIIPTQAGEQALPALAFSWFDPSTHHYVEAHTSPLRVLVSPADAADSSSARNALAESLPSQTSHAAALTPGAPALRPDQVVTGSSTASLVPHYFQSPYIAPPTLLALAFLSAGFWVRRRERASVERNAAQQREAALQTGPMLAQMDQAAKNNDASLFFQSARNAVQRVLASRWHVSPSCVTIDEARTRLGPQTELAHLFELTDEASYSKITVTAIDFNRWKRVVLEQLNAERVS